MTTLWLVRVGGEKALRAYDSQSGELLEALPNGKMLKAEVTHHRSHAQLRWYWGLIRLVHSNQSRYSTAERLEEMLRVAAGHCDTMITPEGMTVKVPRSIAFAKMDQTQFNSFKDQVIRIVCEHLIPGMDEGKLRAQLEEMVG